MSGFTATGASVLTDVEALGRGLLFWRQLSHWLGGMGIIVLAIAVLPRLRVGGRRLLQSELPGPTDTAPLRDTVRETAQRLVLREVGAAVRDEELRLYLALLGLGTAVVTLDLFASGTVEGMEGVRHGAFQAVSVMTTTGFATLDWTTLAHAEPQGSRSARRAQRARSRG